MRKLICSIVLVGVLSVALTACSTYTDKGIDKSRVGDNRETTQIETSIEKPKDIIVADIEGLLAGEQKTIVKYFGESDIYTSDAVKDRVSVAKVTFVSASGVGPIDISYNVKTDGSNESSLAKDSDTISKETEEKVKDTTGIDNYAGIDNGDIEVKVHICTMDYIKTKEAVESLTDRMKTENPTMDKDEMNTKITAEVASRAQNGEFEIHVTIPVKVHYENGTGSLIITEELKLALTGGWYNPTQAEIVSGECPVRAEAQRQVEKEKETEQTEQTAAIIKDNNSGRADSRDSIKKAA